MLDESAQTKHLWLGTVSFTVCFAAWGLITAQTLPGTP
jgi:nitrate/nitrite transporter NarK